MSATMTRVGWLAGGASIRGPAHIRVDKPNEDAIAWQPIEGIGDHAVAAVSDGHGAAAHFRSDRGSLIAVHQAIAILGWHFDEAGDVDAVQLASELVEAWRKAVDADLSAAPIDGAAAGAADRFVPYGATLLAAAVGADALILAQIGDGDLLLGYPDGRIERPLGHDMGLVGEQTYSLCLAGAERFFRILSIDGSRDPLPDFVSLSTDGVAKSFADDAAFEAAIAEFRSFAAKDWGELNAGLSAWLAEVSANGSGDDSSLCLLFRPDNSEPRLGDDR